MEAMPEPSTRTPDFLPLTFPDEPNLRKLSKLKSRKERILFWIHPNLEIITHENHPILRPLTSRFPIIEQIEALQMRSQFQMDSLVITAKELWKKLKRCLLSSKWEKNAVEVGLAQAHARANNSKWCSRRPTISNLRTVTVQRNWSHRHFYKCDRSSVCSTNGTLLARTSVCSGMGWPLTGKSTINWSMRWAISRMKRAAMTICSPHTCLVTIPCHQRTICSSRTRYPSLTKAWLRSVQQINPIRWSLTA